MSGIFEHASWRDVAVANAFSVRPAHLLTNLHSNSSYHNRHRADLTWEDVLDAPQRDAAPSLFPNKAPMNFWAKDDNKNMKVFLRQVTISTD